jgi:galactokinase/mevalonate kinase-like predicted kinase
MKIIRTAAHARAGVLGNPSDGYFGRTISIIVRNFTARVVLYEWPELEIILSHEDRCLFDRLDDLVQDVRLHGYYGGLRLVKAAIKRFAEYAGETGIRLHGKNFALRYETDIPRQVGLAGSSAIITAVFRALMQFYDVSFPREVLPGLILSVETKEIGISAGLQDRVAQVYEGLTYMDFDRSFMEEHGHGMYESLDPALLPPLYIAYRTDLSEVSGVFHNNIRARWESGDESVINAMRQVAGLVLEGKECLLSGNHRRLGELIDENFDVRAGIYRLDPRNVDMVKLARSLGASAHYAGSGGSILGIYHGVEMLRRLREEFARQGCRVIIPIVS